MSNATEGAPPAAPVGTTPPIDPPAPIVPAAPLAAPASTPATDADTVRMTPAQLKARLDEQSAAAQRKLLKELGFEKPEDVKSAAARLKALEDEKLSEQERTQKQLKELAAAVEANKPLATLASEAVDELFKALPAEQQAVIDDEAKGDPAARMRLIRLARRLMPATPPAPIVVAPAAGTPPAAPPLPPPPASTTPPPAAPRPGVVKTKYEQYQEMRAAENPMADIFFSLNERAIKASTPPQ